MAERVAAALGDSELRSRALVENARRIDERATIRYNDLRAAQLNCTIGIGNINADPQFCEINSILKLGVEPDSPCVGAGENGATMGAGGICGVTGVNPEALAPHPLRLTVSPNPISIVAEFSYDGHIETPSLEIFDPQGRLIDLLHPLGPSVHWSPPASLARRAYFARLRGAGVSETVKFLLIR